MWLKFLVYLKLTETFGYLIKIIELMIIDSANFFCIYMVINLAFAGLFTNLFQYDNPS